MIEISKGKEPRELLEYRKQPFASYADMPSALKQKVVQSLLSEQGYLCAYCMCKIGDTNKKHPATIEHCIPQSGSDEKDRLNYRNMVAVCWGNRDAHKNSDKSCDAKRGSLPHEQQNMKVLNVFDGRTLSEIEYKSDGTICSKNPNADEDLNTRLNLNCEARRLKECRRQALAALHNEIDKKYPDRNVPRDYFQKLLTYYSENKKPYCGIMIAWLRKKI